MKKSKLVLVSVLALALCFMCLTSMTFSWFNRPQTQKGDSLGWDIDYEISVGSGVSMVTYESTDGGVNYNEDSPVTEFSNSAGIAPGERKWYRTDIINNGASAQSVSLYLSKLSLTPDAEGSFYLGVNAPLKTYKNYFDEGSFVTASEKAARSTMRVYFQPKSGSMSQPDNNWINRNYYVCYGVDSAPSNYLALSQTPTSGTYYADIPANATQLFFSVQDWKHSYQRTQTFTDLKSDGQSDVSSLVFYLDGTYDKTYDNAWAQKVKVTEGANVVNYYNSITLPAEESFDASLVAGTDYIGNSITYTSENNSIFTVDSASGTISAKTQGEAKLITEVKGTFNDTVRVETTVKVGKAVSKAVTADVPIVTNFRVNGINDEGEATVESIYWFIKNDSESGTLIYNVEDIYLTL